MWTTVIVVDTHVTVPNATSSSGNILLGGRGGGRVTAPINVYIKSVCICIRLCARRIIQSKSGGRSIYQHIIFDLRDP